MTITLIPKRLAFIQLGTSAGGTIYDPPSSKRAWVHNILIHNAHATLAQTILINLHDGTNEYEIFNLTLVVGETVQLTFPGEGLCLESTDKITGSTTTATCVTAVVDGSEET